MSAAPVTFIWTGEEIWRPAVGFSSYEVSNFGRIRRSSIIQGGQGSVRPVGHILTARPLPRGHLQVTLSENNNPKTMLVHRMVALAFLGAPPPGKDCVLHKDDDPSNNRPENLYWGNRADNSRDKVARNRQARGEMIANAKLSTEEIQEIREKLRTGVRQRIIAEEFGVSQSNIALIATRKIWGHLP